AEVAALRPFSNLPVTTNLMGFYEELDSRRLAKVCDCIGWDAYPDWHGSTSCSNGAMRSFDGLEGDTLVASELAFLHDLHRGLKEGQPWLLMESTPSNINWRKLSHLKEPGVNRLAGLQAVAHGADSVAYFQWRKGRGGCESFHGAVVDHVGHGETRTFREVAALSRDLAILAPLAGTRVSAEAAIIYDWEVRWQQEQWKHARNTDKDYPGTCVQHYRPLWRRSLACDVIGPDADLTRYRLLVAPALYAVHPGVADRLEAFVSGGGLLLATAPCGVVDDNDLAFTNGRPGPLRQLFGVWAEEMDVAEDGAVTLVPATGDPLCLGPQKGGGICELLHAENCEVLANYEGTWYAGRPALTRRRHGKGWAYYLATRGAPALLDILLAHLADEAGLAPALSGLPSPVTAQVRAEHLFLFNWGREVRRAVLPRPMLSVLQGGAPLREVDLGPWDVAVLRPST
ncbi:MAG: beta-galactosidase trimerization domain-containing protein, partial [Planctomycetes bacterium]|nr:beta-galactosidase trimerization domain-containing protein [Planctomycetota bacterium]